MTKGTPHGSFAAPISEILVRKFRGGVVVVLGLALAIVPAVAVFGQTTQQQQEQQREEQQREEQQRQDQAREQQQREQQAREQQQREEQQRQEQAREQQQREQQAREQQQREEQQRQEQAREQQAREQQQRDQQLREAQQRNLQTTSIPAPNSSPAEKSPVSGPISATSKGSDESGAVSPKAKPGSVSQAPGDRNPRSDPQSQRPERIGQSPDLRQRVCDKEPCPELGPKPGLRPLRPDPNVKLCNNGPCPLCGPGQSPGKNNSCVAATAVKEAAAPPRPSAIPQVCAAGQVWNGVQCAPVGAQQCRAGEMAVGTTCQPDCTIATAEAQNYIVLLWMARTDKDNNCTRNPTGKECQLAELTYAARLNEYRAFLGGIPITCILPDPMSI